MYRYCIIVLLTLGIIACGDSPMSPEEAIVGTWVFEETNISAVFAKGMEEYLVSQGVGRDIAKDVVGEVINSGQLEASMSGWIRMSADNTWVDNAGDSGTWRIDGEELVRTQGSLLSFRLMFTLDGDTLTLIYPRVLVADMFRLFTTTTSTEEERLLNALIANLEDISVVYKRRTSGG